MAKPKRRGTDVGEVHVDGNEVWLWTGQEWIRSDIVDAEQSWAPDDGNENPDRPRS
jgi:hypothetical protein